MLTFAKHVKIRQEKHGAVVFDTLQEKVFVTNETGAQILRLLEKGLSPREMVAALAEQYARGRDSIQQEVEEFLQQLKASELVEKEEESRT